PDDASDEQEARSADLLAVSVLPGIVRTVVRGRVETRGIDPRGVVDRRDPPRLVRAGRHAHSASSSLTPVRPTTVPPGPPMCTMAKTVATPGQPSPRAS